MEVLHAYRTAGGLDLGISASGQAFARSVPPLQQTNVVAGISLAFMTAQQATIPHEEG
jgi:hypothetical protein